LVRDKEIESLTLDPADYGLSACTPEDLAIKDPIEGAMILRELLSGGGPKPMQEMLIFNVGLALKLLKGVTMSQAMEESREAIKSGVGSKLLPNPS
jgi:anthranilate phosphoribosyltransferase